MLSDKMKSNITFILTGISLSIIIYIISYIVFNDLSYTIEELLLSIASLPISFIYQTLLINRILEKREKVKSAKKINMIIGFFYLEIGTDLISIMLDGDVNLNEVREKVSSEQLWENAEFEKLLSLLKDYPCHIDMSKIDLSLLQLVLDSKDDLIVELILNPIFDSDDKFINLLTSLLRLRNLFQDRYYQAQYFDEAEYCSVSTEICNVYYGLLEEWVYYMEHLQKYSPLLFAKAIIYSPFSTLTRVEQDEAYLKLISKYKENATIIETDGGCKPK